MNAFDFSKAVVSWSPVESECAEHGRFTAFLQADGSTICPKCHDAKRKSLKRVGRMMSPHSALIGLLCLPSVAFFLLWRFEKGRGDELLRALWAEIDRHQMARLRARSATREVV